MTWGIGARERTSTTEHRAWRRAVLERDGYCCQVRGPQCAGHAVEADHIRAVAEGGAPADIRNGQAICRPCHLAKTAAEGQRGAARRRAASRIPVESHPGAIGASARGPARPDTGEGWGVPRTGRPPCRFA